jgi:hypothetical protein
VSIGVAIGGDMSRGSAENPVYTTPLRNAEVKRAVISASASGSNQIVAAVSGKKIVVLGYTIVAAGAVTAQWKSGSTNISGAMSLAANGGAAVPTVDNEIGCMETAADAALNLNLGGAVSVAGHLTYIEV